MKSAGKARNNGLYRHIRTSKEIIRNLLNDYVKNARILVLDEPTAAMDAISEKAFYEKYMRLSKLKSCILISHRLKSTNLCDTIVVMEKGQIAERGTHEELMNGDTKYRAMYELQSSFYQ